MRNWLRRFWNKEGDPQTQGVRQETVKRFEQLIESTRALEQSKIEEQEGNRLAQSLNRINRVNHFAERVEQALKGLST